MPRREIEEQGGNLGSKRKKVCVMFEADDTRREKAFEVSFEKDPHFSTDLEALREGLCKKSKVVKSLFEDTTAEWEFRRESLDFPGTWGTVGDDSPIKDKSKLLCVNNNKIPVYTIGKELNLSDMTDYESDLSVLGVPVEVDNPGSQSVASTSNLQPQPISNLPKSGAKSTNNLCRTLDFKHYQIPTSFSLSLNETLKKGNQLSPKEYTKLVQCVCDSIIAFTHAPDTESLREILDRLYAKFPCIIVKDECGLPDRISTTKYLLEKLQERMGKLRRQANLQLSHKGGRPKRTPDCVDQRPGQRREEGENGVDMVSYLSNVDKFLDAFRRSESPQVLKALWHATFKGRRYELLKGLCEDMDILLKERCPLLSQPRFLCDEMDLIFESQICRQIRERWLMWVPAILKVAEKEKSSSILKILESYDPAALNDSFETKSSAALELLPILIPGSKRSFEARRYFYDFREDSVNVNSVINEKTWASKKKRMSPYILRYGDTFNIVADGKLFMESSSGSMEALVNLISTFYVFNIQWCPHVIPTYLFLQSELLQKRDGDVRKCASLNIFLNLARPFLETDDE